MDYDSLLRVTNHSDERVVFMFNSQRFIVPPQGEAYISFDAVIRSMGDPRSGLQQQKIEVEGGMPVFIPSRQQELQRLSTLYGCYTETVDAPCAVEGSHGKSLLQMLPNITATNIDDQDPIVFPAQDPDCTQFAPISTDTTQMAVMQRQLEKLRRNQILLEQQLKQKNIPQAVETISSSDLEEDTPQGSVRTRTKV